MGFRKGDQVVKDVLRCLGSDVLTPLELKEKYEAKHRKDVDVERVIEVLLLEGEIQLFANKNHDIAYMCTPRIHWGRKRGTK